MLQERHFEDVTTIQKKATSQPNRLTGGFPRGLPAMEEVVEPVSMGGIFKATALMYLKACEALMRLGILRIL